MSIVYGVWLLHKNKRDKWRKSGREIGIKKQANNEECGGFGRPTEYASGKDSGELNVGAKETERQDKLENLLRFKKKPFLPFYKLCSFILSFRQFAVGLRYLFDEPKMKHIMKKKHMK